MNQQLTKIDEREAEMVDVAPPLSLTESAAIGLARAEIDVQIATARQYPRSIARASKNIRDLVTLDKEAAAECMYALPRGGKPIQGPSIRLAEIIFQCWGNARCDARVIDIDRVEKVVVAQGIYHDLETNSAGRATVRRSIVDRKGKIFSDDMITVTGNAACSIAKRNAILAGVPKAVWNRAYMDAREVVAGTIKTLAVSRDQAIAAFANFGVKPEQIFPSLGVGGLEEITLDHIPILRGMFSAIKNGEATVEEMFDARKGPSTHEKVANPLSDSEPEHDPQTGEVKQAPDSEASADDGGAQAGKTSGGEIEEHVLSADAKQAIEAAQAESEAGNGDASKDTPPAADPKPNPEKIALLERLRAKAAKGVASLTRALGGLKPEERALLGESDNDGLRDLAEASDGAARDDG